MPCKECAERREKLINAVIEGRIAAAAGHAFKGAAEMAGLKAKAPAIELDGIKEEDGTAQKITVDASFIKPQMPKRPHRS